MTITTVSGRDLARLFGVHDRTIRDLADEGLVVKLSRGRFDRDASITRYVTHLRDAAAGRGGASGVASLTSERSRLAREQADAVSLKNATLRGELVSATEVQSRWTAILAAVRARLLAVPSRVGLRSPHLTREDVAVLDQELRDALEEVAA